MHKIILFSGVIALLCASCTSRPQEKEDVQKFTVTNAVAMDTSLTKEYVSQIKSVRNIEIRAQERGFLQQICVDEGQHVTAGQVLFKIMPKMYEAEVDKSESEVKAAEIELQNAKTLADKNIISRSEQSVAEAKLKQAKAESSVAKLHLSFTEIRAPFAGTIDRIPKKLGSLIDEGELLTSLSDNSEMFAYYNVSEPEYLQYQTDVKDRGDKTVTLMLANGTPLAQKGKVEVIESEFDAETGNIAFRAKFPNPQQLLRNGETGKVLMTVPFKNVLLIPQKATYEIQDKIYVYVIDKDNKVHSREITIAGEMPDLYAVSSGLTADEKFVLEGVQNLHDDQKITFTVENGKQVISHLKLKAE